MTRGSDAQPPSGAPLRTPARPPVTPWGLRFQAFDLLATPVAVINGRAMDQEQGRGGLRLAAPLPSEVFSAVHAAMVKACEDRLAGIAIEMRGMGVEP